KTGFFEFFLERLRGYRAWILPVLSILTFISSWIGIYPPDVIERRYARGFFPKVSHLAGRFADLIPFSWLDLIVPSAVVFLIIMIRNRCWRWLANGIAVMYLIFFWTWGLNYHRQTLTAKLQVDAARMQPQAMEEFARHAAMELNRLYREKQNDN